MIVHIGGSPSLFVAYPIPVSLFFPPCPVPPAFFFTKIVAEPLVGSFSSTKGFLLDTLYLPFLQLGFPSLFLFVSSIVYSLTFRSLLLLFDVLHSDVPVNLPFSWTLERAFNPCCFLLSLFFISFLNVDGVMRFTVLTFFFWQ